MFGFGRKADLYDACWGKGVPSRPLRALPPPAPDKPAIPTLSVDQLPSVRYSFHDGEKFAGGYGPTQVLFTDYWTLRARSRELFTRNPYASGVIKRLITNEINTGLHLEATPEESLLGFEEDGLADWAETVENRFNLWAKEPKLCDQRERRTFGAIQAAARREALIAGDVLVLLPQDRRTMLPRARLIPGERVQTPMEAMGGKLPSGNRVVHGVELDSLERQVAYWVRQEDGTTKRLPAYGEKSGRRLAFLYYGTEPMEGEVRGQPLLGLMLQSLKEIDRYRDSTQRKAVINSFLAMFIKRDVDKAPSRVLTGAGGAVRRAKETAVDAQGNERSYHVQEQIPGVVVDELQVGEEPHGFRSDGTDEKFGEFERAIVQLIAWCLEIPPEVLMLSYGSNYSASQAAINEFKMYLNKVRTDFGDQFCQPIYVEWLLSEVLNQRIKAPGLLEAWRDPLQYDVLGAWFSSDWTGQIKPAVDFSRLVTGYTEAIGQGLCTRDRASRELTGTKYSKNVQKLKRENDKLYEALRLVTELKAVAVGAAAAVVDTEDTKAVNDEPTDEDVDDPETDDDEEDTEEE